MLSQSLSDLVYEEILQIPLTLVHVKKFMLVTA